MIHMIHMSAPFVSESIEPFRVEFQGLSREEPEPSLTIFLTRISEPAGPLILDVDLRHILEGGCYGQTDTPIHDFIYAYRF